MLTDLEAVFRSLKSELGMRPVYHQTTERVEGHLSRISGNKVVHLLLTALPRANTKARGSCDPRAPGCYGCR